MRLKNDDKPFAIASAQDTENRFNFRRMVSVVFDDGQARACKKHTLAARNSYEGF
jgi:hypothetical protein